MNKSKLEDILRRWSACVLTTDDAAIEIEAMLPSTVNYESDAAKVKVANLEMDVDLFGKGTLLVDGKLIPGVIKVDISVAMSRRPQFVLTILGR